MNAIAGQINARKVASGNGGGCRHVQVRQICERAAVGAGRPPRNALTGHIPLKRISATLIQLANLVAIESLVSDLHPSAKCPDCGHLLDCKSDSLGSRGEATVMGRRAPPDTLVLWHKQLGRRVVVKRHADQIARFEFAFLHNSIKGPSALFMRY